MKNSGFIEILLAVTILIIILSLFGISLTSIFNNETLKANFLYVLDWVKFGWVWFLDKISIK
ncbi:MAG: hypothetical protein AAB930_03650 [Patescibacteria group bacterium]